MTVGLGILVLACVGSFVGGFVTCFAVFRRNPKLKNKADGIADIVEK